MKRRIYIWISVFSVLAGLAMACSSAIVAPGGSGNNRPLLWKHRDAREAENDLRYFKGPDYSFIGLVNTNDIKGEQVWAGSNSAGFAVMNTNAYNLPKGDYKGPMDQDGYFMKEALGICGSVDDFEKLLQAKKGKLGVIACFGVIDAKGGAAYFEVSPMKYEKFDVTDPDIAPHGYLIRTNFGFSGKKNAGSGYIRYRTLAGLFNNHKGKISSEFLLKQATRCLKHSILNRDLENEELPSSEGEKSIVVFRDYIVRGGSVSSMVVEGVTPKEDPALTTIWTIPAFQLSSLTIPTWVAAGEKLPDVVIARDGKPSYITEAALSLKDRAFPIPGRDGRSYLYFNYVMNQEKTGFYQKLLPYEKDILARTNDLLSKWRRDGFNKKEAREFYDKIDMRVRNAYKEQKQ